MRFHTYNTFLESFKANKKFYVSFNLTESNLNELKDLKFVGIKGIAATHLNVAEWFYTKEAMLMMPYDETLSINNLEPFPYDDAERLMANHMTLLRRVIQANDEISGLQHVLTQVAKKIDNILDAHTDNPSIAILSDKWVKGQYFFQNWDENTVADLDALKEYFVDTIQRIAASSRTTIDIPRAVSDKILTNAIILTANTYRDEQEWIVKDNILNIPKSSHLFVKHGDVFTASQKFKADDLIKKHGIDEILKTHFLTREDVNKYRYIKFTPDYLKQRYTGNREDLLKIA